MKRIKSLLRRFPAKVTLILISAMVLMLLLSNSLIYTFTLRAQLESLRSGLLTLARTAGLMIDADPLLKVPLKREGVHSVEFQSIQKIMKRIKAANPQIKFLYTMTKTENEGIWQFMVDADTRAEDVEDKALESYPGNRYEAFRFPEMMKAFDGPSADTRLEIDEWGATLSGYAPIYDDRGQAVAILGIDIDAGDVRQIQIEAQRRIRLVLAFGLALSVLLGIMFARRITDPVVRLVEGTRRIGKGDLQYRVDIKGEDEISELARSFNDMARNLYKSRRRILTYFFNIVRTLVRVLEARDIYTKGHSQAVAEYAAKIAVKMGINKDDIKVFRKMVVLHDIGKIGIEDKILNKPGQLTKEEWEKIKKHPEIGEEILKPVIEDKDLLAVVRAHHERYDGQGYPDKLEKDEINIFAAIVAVADTYDAMTSDRPYRKAMRRDEAIDELKRNRGAQFHPKVVDAFLQILEEEK